MFDNEYEYMWNLLQNSYEKADNKEEFKMYWDKQYQQMLNSSIIVIFGTKTIPENASEKAIDAVREELNYRINNVIKTRFPTIEHTEPAE